MKKFTHIKQFLLYGQIVFVSHFPNPISIGRSGGGMVLPIPFFWSLHHRWVDLWNHPRPSVRMSVCPRYLGDRSLLFPETWQLGRTWIGDKNVPSGFLN